MRRPDGPSNISVTLPTSELKPSARVWSLNLIDSCILVNVYQPVCVFSAFIYGGKVFIYVKEKTSITPSFPTWLVHGYPPRIFAFSCHFMADQHSI